MCVCVCVCVCIVIQTDCFVVSHIFSVARPTRCFKLRSKPS